MAVRFMSGKVAQNQQSMCFTTTQPHLLVVLDGLPRLVWVNQWGAGAGWKEYVMIWMCIQQSRGAQKRRLRYSLTQPVCGSLKIPFGIDAPVMFTVLFLCSVSLL